MLNKERYVFAMFMDLSKTFDTMQDDFMNARLGIFYRILFRT